MSTSAKKVTYLYGVTVDISLQFLDGIVDGLAKEGHDVHVVSSPGRRLEVMATIPGVTVHSLGMERNPHPIKDIWSLVQWLRIIGSVRPDVVIVGTPKAGLLGTLAAKVLRIPRRVYILHGLRLETATGLLRRILTLFEKKIFRWSTDVIAVSKSLQRRVAELGIDPHGLAVVLGEGSPNGIDLSKFDPSNVDVEVVDACRAQWGLEPGPMTIGFVGRLVLDKGIIELTSAVRGLIEDGQDVQLLVVGDQDQTSSLEINEHFRRLGNRVKFTGWLEDTRPAYRLFDVLCLPSYREGLNTAILEAGAMGIPVVGTDVTGIRDVITDGSNGVLVPKGSIADLREALGSVLLDYNYRSTLGANLKKTVQQYFSRPAVVKTHIEYLSSNDQPGDLSMQADRHENRDGDA